MSAEGLAQPYKVMFFLAKMQGKRWKMTILGL